MRVVVVSSTDPLAAPYEADLDSVSVATAPFTDAAAVGPSSLAAANAASQFDELARLSPQIRAIVQVHHTNGSDIPTPSVIGRSLPLGPLGAILYPLWPWVGAARRLGGVFFCRGC